MTADPERLSLGLGTLLYRRDEGAADPNKLNGMSVAPSGWFLVAFLESLPFTLVAWIVAMDPDVFGVPGDAATRTLAVFENPLNGVFGSTSGFIGSD